jgi:lysophospholipase L1-like esterase
MKSNQRIKTLQNVEMPQTAVRFTVRTVAAALFSFILFAGGIAWATELSVEDFDFDGILGSDGATIERIAPNHFKIHLVRSSDKSPNINMCQFTITDHAAGNSLRLDGVALGTRGGFGSWSYDRKTWHPITDSTGHADSKSSITLLFPRFTENQVYFGTTIPMSYEKMVELLEQWARHPHASMRCIGKSLEGRDIYRLTVTDPDSPIPLSQRWGHHAVNQHCQEYNAMWRIAGMVDWLLSKEGVECRKRSVCHFVVQMNVDGPHNGWKRANKQGIDMNRAYAVSGWKDNPAHESQIVQRDLEQLHATGAPITTTWSMHAWWTPEVEPLLRPGPEMGTTVGSWSELRDLLESNDDRNLFKPIRRLTSTPSPTHWCSGTHLQLKASAFCVEGSGRMPSKDDNIHSGAVLMKSISQFYGEKPAKPKPHKTIKPVYRGTRYAKKRNKLINERIEQSKGNIDLLFIGDSITACWEDSGKDVWKRYYGGRNAVNMGVSGDRIQHTLWRLDNGQLDGISPKLAVLMIGTNNSARNTSEEIAEGVGAIVKIIRRKLPETKLLLHGIFPRGATPEYRLRQVNQKANQIFSKLDDGERIIYLDIGEKFFAAEWYPDERRDARPVASRRTRLSNLGRGDRADSGRDTWSASRHRVWKSG